ncbi:MAG: hypothetical protein Q7J32_04470 [Sphingomonadaceae bacterium]|nr:hypothetical protein [Sphingomonadaceae bacterium]
MIGRVRNAGIGPEDDPDDPDPPVDSGDIEGISGERRPEREPPEAIPWDEL